jgi:hypothetical protein
VSTTADVAAFWSYSHDDDAGDDGGIFELANRIRDEFSLLTGTALELFVDRDAIQWGDEWRRRIDGALRETTFFIPIITPRYFKRPECRRELVTFVGQAESLGLRDLVLPILYVAVSDLSEDNPDEAVALVARTQYEDWTRLRLAGPGSREYRTAVNMLATRLAEAAASVTAKQLVAEEATSEAADRDVESPGLIELADRINALLTDWLIVVEEDPVNEAQHDATMRVFRERRARLAASSPPRGAVFALLAQMGTAELPLARRRLGHAETYAAHTIELDPLVHAAIRAVEAFPQGWPLLERLHAGVRDAKLSIDASLASLASGDRPMTEVAKEYAAMSKTWREIRVAHERADALVADGNALVEVWSDRLEALAAAAAARADP